MASQSELARLANLNDPNYAISLAVGPPFPELKAQPPGSGLQLGRRAESQPKR
jgi:hypothetical protein